MFDSSQAPFSTIRSIPLVVPLNSEADLRSALSKQSAEASEKEKASKEDPEKLKALRLEITAQYEKTLTAFGNKIGVLSKTLQPAPDAKETEEAVKKILK
jgi:hypothetical protein